MSKRNGFTLIELLVVIAILAVLSTIAVTSFRGVQQKARDTQRKENVDTIAKIYEGKYRSNGLYQPITAADFTAGFPTLPGGATFTGLLTSPAKGFQICAPLDDFPGTSCDTPRDTCYCKQSTRGSYTSTSVGSTSVYLDHPATCDPYGILDNGLVGYWKMDEASWNGTSGEVKDSSGNGNNGVSVAGTAINSPPHTQPFPTNIPSSFNNAGSFDGINDGISINNSISLNLTASTVSLWTYQLGTVDATTQRSLAGKIGSFYLQISYGKPRFNIYSAGGSGCNTTRCQAMGSNLIVPSQWYHLVGTFDGSVIKVYQDGVLQASQDWNYPLDQNTNLSWIGSNLWGNTNGLIDDVRIYNRALSSNEVSSLYNSGNGCAPQSDAPGGTIAPTLTPTTAATPTPTPTTAAPTATPTTVPSGLFLYADSPRSGWVNSSFGATTNLSATSPVYAGSTAISSTINGAWGALAVATWDSANYVNTTPYTRLQFYIHGGASGNQKLNFFIYKDLAGTLTAGPSVAVDSFITGGSIGANQWRLVDIPLSTLGATSVMLGEFALQDILGTAQPIFYIDSVKLY